MISKNQYWGYVADQAATMETLRTETPSKVTYFKPYLVLNNNKEDDPNNRKTKEVPKEDGTGMEEALDTDYEFVGQCRDRVNSAVPGLWEKVRLKHLTNFPHDSEQYQQILEEASKTDKDANKHYGELNDGIGFEGLAKLTKRAAYVGKVAQGETPDFSEELNLETDLGESKRIANFVASKLGYSSYQEYLYDFSPKGLFSVRDMMNCILGTESPKNLHTRIPLFFTYNVFNSEEQETNTKVDDNNQFKYDSSYDVEKLTKALNAQERADEMQKNIMKNYGNELFTSSEQVVKTVDDVPPMSEEEEDALIAAYTTESKDYAGSMKPETLTDTITGNRIVYNNVGELFYNNLFALLDIASETSLEVYGNTDINNCKKIIKDAEDDKEFVYVLLDYVKEENPDAEVILKNE